MKRPRKRKLHPEYLRLTHSQKRRQWEFFNLRFQSDEISKLLSRELFDDERKELEAKYDALQLRGQQLLEEQTKFLRARHRQR